MIKQLWLTCSLPHTHIPLKSNTSANLVSQLAFCSKKTVHYSARSLRWDASSWDGLSTLEQLNVQCNTLLTCSPSKINFFAVSSSRTHWKQVLSYKYGTWLQLDITETLADAALHLAFIFRFMLIYCKKMTKNTLFTVCKRTNVETVHSPLGMCDDVHKKEHDVTQLCTCDNFLPPPVIWPCTKMSGCCWKKLQILLN